MSLYLKSDPLFFNASMWSDATFITCIHPHHNDQIMETSTHSGKLFSLRTIKNSRPYMRYRMLKPTPDAKSNIGRHSKMLHSKCVFVRMSTTLITIMLMRWFWTFITISLVVLKGHIVWCIEVFFWLRIITIYNFIYWISIVNTQAALTMKILAPSTGHLP